MLPISNSGKYFEIKGTLMHICKSPYTEFPKWGRLVEGGGDNLGKMAKNGMKITKSAFLVGGTWGGGQANFGGSGGDNPQSPPTRENPAICSYSYKNNTLKISHS